MRLTYKKVLTGLAMVAILGGVTAPAVSAQQSGAQLTVTGPANVPVSLDGINAVSGATVFSGSRVVTPAGATATVAFNGTQVTLAESTDAVFSFNGSAVRVDVVCGAATGSAAPGGTLEIFTQADANVHATGAGIRVNGEGKSMELAGDEQVSVAGSTKIMLPAGASAEMSTVNCNCMCNAAPVFPAGIVAVANQFPGWAIAALIAGTTVAVITPFVIDDDEPVSPSAF